jgi:phosphoglycerate dehydrogenase-like enzyme
MPVTATAASRRSPALRRIVLHVQNDPTSPVDAVTPEAFRAAARQAPALARRLVVSYADDPAALDERLGEAEILLTGYFPSHDLARRAPRLRWIQSTSAGVEKLVPDLPPHIVLTNASGVHGPKGGEYALTALLMLNHLVPHYVTRQRERKWDPRFASTIAGKTVVLVGVGRIGAAVARLCRRFGLRVLGVRRSGHPHPLVERTYPPRAIGRALAQADFVVVSAPLTPETRGLLGRAELDRLPRHAGLVNLGRAAVVDYDHLAAKLQRGELGGAVLDVLPEEPLPADSPLWTTANVILSPHCAVDDVVTYVPRALAIFFDNLARYVAGRPLRNRVDPGRGY